ncbi:MAG: PhoPQ-activated protein PqaA family protein [Armatimonadota bacterium]|nr:PhoPQ-activated protein PqaA family protein [Armatimonadota bacterium]
MWRWVPLSLLIVFATCMAWATPLDDYVAAQDNTYSWQIVSTREMPEGFTLLEMSLTSQKWREIVWKHRVYVIKPAQLKTPELAVLYITGSSGMSEIVAFGQVASRVGAMCVILNDVPNQPLFGGRVEDELISYTFVEFAKTGDKTWPALLPMTKSAVRAMTAVQEVAKQQWDIEVKEFLVTGGSKRGWTTWLTAAVDRRVRAIAPMVYDILNFPKQLPHQVATWGKYSEMIADYSSKGLTEMLSTAEGQTLTAMVDPYSYRERYKMPKMIVNGTNDRYWVIDAAQFYFNDLPGEKYLLYVPNAGHSLREGLPRVISNLIAFYLAVASKQPLAQIQADVRREGSKLRVTVTTKGKVEGVQVWTAQSGTKDLRNARWMAQDAQPAGNGKYVAEIALPSDVAAFALFADAKGSVNGTEYHVCTIPVVTTLK